MKKDGKCESLNSREKFFDENQLYLLYLWHMMNKHGLVGLLMNLLHESIAAMNGAEGVLSVISKQ